MAVEVHRRRQNAGELYGRVLVVFAAQHYAHDLVLPTSQRRGSVLPRSRKDTARKAFERLTKEVLPASHVELRACTRARGSRLRQAPARARRRAPSASARRRATRRGAPTWPSEPQAAPED